MKANQVQIDINKTPKLTIKNRHTSLKYVAEYHRPKPTPNEKRYKKLKDWLGVLAMINMVG
jgi:hypothetical protein